MGAGQRKGLFCLAAQLPWLVLSPATCRAKSPLTKPTQANLSRGRLAELAREAGFRMGRKNKNKKATRERLGQLAVGFDGQRGPRNCDVQSWLMLSISTLDGAARNFNLAAPTSFMVQLLVGTECINVPAS